MAALCEEFTLCGLQSLAADGNRRDGLQGIEEAGDGDRVLLTEAERTVTLYKVSDQKPLGSWAVKQGQRITCPAIYNHGTGEYTVVHDDKVLRIWKDEDVNFDKVFKATLSTDVYRIHSLPGLEPLVLFCRGAVRHLDTLLADPRQEIDPVIAESETIRYVLFLVVKDVCGGWSPNIDEHYREDSSGHLCWSSVPLFQSEGTETELLASTLLQLPEPAETGALIDLDDSHIATLTPSSSKHKDCLCIWSTSFQTMQECKYYSQKTRSQLWNYDGKLFVPHGNSLQVLRYICEPSCLASALGKAGSSQKHVLFHRHAIMSNSGTSLIGSHLSGEYGVSFLEGTSVLLSNIQKATERQLSDLVQKAISFQDSPDFQITAGKMVQVLVNRCRSDSKFYPQKLLTDLIQTGQLSYSLCPDFMALCLEKSDVQLLHMCLQQFIDIPESFICSCLKTFLGASEDIVQDATLDTTSVERYIQADEPSTAPEEPMDPTPVLQNGYSSGAAEEDSSDVQMFDKAAQKPKTKGCPVSLKRAALLNTVLITPYSETYLLPQLKDLTSDQVILFLSYLLYLYKLCSELLTENLPGEEELTITQIIDWMNLILDANFTVLVMLPKAKPLIYSLQKCVRLQMKFLSELNKLEGSLSELQKLRRPHDHGQYSIEVLELY
ncbi:nucleolar protein 11 [Gastrophryne carolinensis]